VIRSFLFDMGNVLVRFSHARMCAQIGALCGWSEAEIRRVLIDSGLQWDFERGLLSEQEFHHRLQKIVECDLDFEALRWAGSDIFTADAGIERIVAELSRRGHRLVVLSNTSVSHFEFVRRHFPILRHFDDFVLSYEVGALKPQPEIFQAALARIDCPPEHCFYTDDVPEYVAAGRSFGLQAAVYTAPDALRQALGLQGVELPPA